MLPILRFTGQWERHSFSTRMSPQPACGQATVLEGEETGRPPQNWPYSFLHCVVRLPWACHPLPLATIQSPSSTHCRPLQLQGHQLVLVTSPHQEPQRLWPQAAGGTHRPTQHLWLHSPHDPGSASGGTSLCPGLWAADAEWLLLHTSMSVGGTVLLLPPTRGPGRVGQSDSKQTGVHMCWGRRCKHAQAQSRC